MITDDFKDQLQEHEKELQESMQEYEAEIKKINDGEVGHLKQVIKELQIEVTKKELPHLDTLLADILSFYGVKNEVLNIIFNTEITADPKTDCLNNFKKAFPELSDQIAKLVYEIPIPKEQENIRKIKYGHAGINFQKRLSEEQMNEIKNNMEKIFNMRTKQKKEGKQQTIRDLAEVFNYQIETNEDTDGNKTYAKYSVMDTILLAYGGFFSQTILYEQAKELLTPYDNEDKRIQNILSKSYTKDDKFKFGVNLIKILSNGSLLNKMSSNDDSGKKYYEEQNNIKTKKGQKSEADKQSFDIINKYLNLWIDEIKEICETPSNKAYKTPYELELLINHLSAKSNAQIYPFLQEWFKKKYDCYKDYETLKTYLKTDEGFKEIELPDLVVMIKQTFQKLINYKNIRRLIDDCITEPVTSNYNLISFRNGVLNTTTEEFHYGLQLETVIPKIYIYDYEFIESFEEAERVFKDTALYNELSEALNIDSLIKDDEITSEHYTHFKNNEENFFMGVGNTAMATNEMEKMFILNGKPGTMKSTILTMLKRVFKAVPLSLQTIADGNQFSLAPAVRRDIAIDDDVSTTTIKNNGRLNSFITQTSLSAEIKGKNEIIDMTGSIVPVIFSSGNNLPSVRKEGGFSRRVCLIILNNLIDPSKKTKKYMNDIIRGKRDPEIVKLLNYAILLFFQNRDDSEFSAEIQKNMINEWAIKSFPVKVLANELYMDSIDFETEAEAIDGVEGVRYENNKIIVEYKKIRGIEKVSIDEEIQTYVLANEVTREIRKAFKKAKEENRIIEETASPTPKMIRAGFGANGFDYSRKSVRNDEGEWSSENVYLECIPRKKLEKLKELIKKDTNKK